SRPELDRVLSAAVERVRSGGRLFVASVRHLQLRRAFHCVQQLAAAESDASFSPVRERVNRAIQHDLELAVDPRCFTHVARELPRVSGVLVHPHQGANLPDVPFLFDVSIYINHSAPALPHDLEQLTWNEHSSLSWLSELLDTQPSALVVRDIPDRRVLDA